jgi:hypothetical protein
MLDLEAGQERGSVGTVPSGLNQDVAVTISRLGERQVYKWGETSNERRSADEREFVSENAVKAGTLGREGEGVTGLNGSAGSWYLRSARSPACTICLACGT